LLGFPMQFGIWPSGGHPEKFRFDASLLLGNVESHYGNIWHDTVDGRNPANQLDVKNLVNNGMNYQPQVVNAVSFI